MWVEEFKIIAVRNAVQTKCLTGAPGRGCKLNLTTLHINFIANYCREIPADLVDSVGNQDRIKVPWDHLNRIRTLSRDIVDSKKYC